MAAALRQKIGSNSGTGTEVHPETDGRRVVRDELGWVKGVRWALNRDGGYCRADEHAPSDYLGPNPVFVRVSQKEREGRKLPAQVRTCGLCKPKGKD